MIRRSERGSVFTVLLGALAISAALSVATYQLMTGPVASMSRLTKKTAADTQMLTVSKIVIMDAVNQAAGGDCDSDSSVEPKEWLATAGGKPTNGGLIPLTIGAPVTDPWNTDYGYCVWDVGAQNDPAVDNGCGAGALRLLGSPTPIAGDATTQTVLAVISAGPNRSFSTTCNAYVDATTDLITTSGDDIVLRYTYAEAAAATDSLWSLKAGDPDVAEIAKDLEISAGGGGTGSIIAAGGIKPGTEATISACAAGVNVGMIRYNTATPGLEVCNGASGWAAAGSGGGAADTFQPDAAIDCTEDLDPVDGIADHLGEVRYNTTTEVPEFCDGTGWRPFALSIPGVNLVLSPASATMNVDGATNEDPVTCSVAGWNCGLETTFTLTNTGSTQSAAPVTALTNTTNFAITSNTCTANPLDTNEACTIVVRPKANGNLTYTGNLTITANNNPFATLQGTASGFGCTPGRTGGGGIYVACNQDDADGMGTYNLVIMPSGCNGSTLNPTCSGNDTAVIQKAYGPSGELPYICQDNDHSCKGAKQAVTMAAMHSFGYGTFGAASYCDLMEYNGKTDWYLPNQYEMQFLIYPQKAAGTLTGFVADNYRTSNESLASSYNAAIRMNMSTGSTVSTNGSRTSSDYTRCVRRDDLALPSATADTNPDDVSFPMSVTTSSGARVSSAAVTIDGFLQPVTVTVTSATGNPKVKINGGAEAASGTLTAINQTVQLVMDAPVVAGTKNTMTLTIGPDSYTWYVGYANPAGDAMIFVTSATYNGAEIGGLAGADSKCQSAATATGYSGTWTALLGSSTISASSRIPFNWATLKRTDGTTVASGWSDLWDGSLAAAIYTENATASTDSVWTNAASDGSIKYATSNNTCADWSAINGNDTGLGSSVSTSSNWLDTGGADDYCSSGKYFALYCVSDNPGTDTTPSMPATAGDFAYAVQVPASTLTTSNAVTVAGLGNGVNATVTITGASGSPGFNVNGAPGTSGVTTVANGDEIELFMTSPAAANTSYLMTVTIGDGDAITWRVWTTGDPTGTVVKRVFVKSAVNNGNLAGVAGADITCTNAATAAGLGGSWKAILSGVSEAEAAVNRIGYNWSILKLIDNTTIVTTTGNLWKTDTTPLTNPILQTETGAVVAGYLTHSNTRTDGLNYSTNLDNANCSAWSSSSGTSGNNVHTGQNSQTTSAWINWGFSGVSCSFNTGNYYHLYCIEQ